MKRNIATLPNTWCQPADAGMSSYRNVWIAVGNPVRWSTQSLSAFRRFFVPFAMTSTALDPTRSWCLRPWFDNDPRGGARVLPELCHPAKTPNYGRGKRNASGADPNDRRSPDGYIAARTRLRCYREASPP